MAQKNKIIIIVLILIVVVVLGMLIWGKSFLFKNLGIVFEKPKVVEETLVIPETKAVEAVVGRTPSTDKYAVPLVPTTEGEKVIVPNAVLTLKGSYDVALPKAQAWAKDAKLVFLTSQGAVTLEGKSSSWQVAFGSASKKKGYEVIIQGDKIVSEKEIPSTEYGYDLPTNWYDAGEAIVSLQTLPQFADATVSSINFFYNKDGKRWGYALGTSRGTTSMPVR
ncbi:hypothetical protein A3A05_00715 [Candidatus Nomurabacteria bacterium RIFCSPLOWO2_01_FULL_41_12]|uniref:Uncharacterized protein n=1 Tax=Candidatus Nomurabacteria bacterium RIFCSPLOWO2_01_FULL_41_12 TaxID=1801774 RepID=A0A1F6WVG8_9BACT|nr:MAG: hypothetical protein A3A05_00715 [Candidatus Nomurabacteria bacterium RIFCSPLOWO2_01_FULL_41_12]